MKMYLVQFTMCLDPQLHTRIVITKNYEAWKAGAEKCGAFIVAEHEMDDEEAMRGQKYYKIILSL